MGLKTHISALACVLLAAPAFIASPVAVAQQVTAADKIAANTVKHVLLISVDGLHALDVENALAADPTSNIAHLAKHAVRYTNASTAVPSDSFPGLAALVTGGSPQTAGFWYDVSYNRKLAPPATTTPYGVVGGANLCPGTAGTITEYDESIDNDYTLLDGGGGINPNYLPRDPANGCAPVYPHSYLRVNTIFEVAHQAGLATAWIDKHPAYEWTNGPSGVGVSDFWGPEINSVPVALSQVPYCSPLPDPANATPSSAWTDSFQNIQCYDALKVQGVLNQIDGYTHNRSSAPGVPSIFGMNFQAFSVGEKLNGGGYTDTFGTPSAGLASEAAFIDGSIGLMVKELKAEGLLDSTLIIISAKHGQSPIDVTKKVAIANGPNVILGNLEATDISDDGSLIWLNTPSDTVNAVQQLSQNQDALGIQEIFAGKQIENKFDSPLADERTPDIILKTNTGAIFTGGSKIAEHGGFNEDDTHVGLLFSLPSLSETVVKTVVTNQQVAPSILKALGLDPKALQAVKAEGTTVLPFLF